MNSIATKLRQIKYIERDDVKIYIFANRYWHVTNTLNFGYLFDKHKYIKYLFSVLK